MYIPKKYGQSRINPCPFCGKTAVAENPQGVPVCSKHLKNFIPDLKCLCGDWLEIKKGKWGPYCHCLRCGNLNFKRILEINPKIEVEQTTETESTIGNKETKNKKPVSKKQEEQPTQKEITIDSNDPNFFD